MKKMKKTTNAGKTTMEIGAGLVAAGAAAAAGYYFYGSKKAKTHRKIAAKWATDMKNEVVKEVKGLEKVSPKAFAAIVDRVAKTYVIARSVDARDLKRAANELKANWNLVKGETRRTVRKTGKAVRTSVRKTVSRAKKSVKTVAKRRK